MKWRACPANEVTTAMNLNVSTFRSFARNWPSCRRLRTSIACAIKFERLPEHSICRNPFRPSGLRSIQAVVDDEWWTELIFRMLQNVRKRLRAAVKKRATAWETLVRLVKPPATAGRPSEVSSEEAWFNRSLR